MAAGLLAAPGDADAPAALADATDEGTAAPTQDQPEAIAAAAPQTPAAREFAQVRVISFVGLLARGIAGGALMPRNGLIGAVVADAPEAAADVPSPATQLVPAEAAEKADETAGPALAALDATAPVTDATPVAEAAPEISSSAAELLPAPQTGETGDAALLAMLDTARQPETPTTAGRASDLAQPFAFDGFGLAEQLAALPGEVTEDTLSADPLTLEASVAPVTAFAPLTAEQPAILASAAAEMPAPAVEPAQTARRDPAEMPIRFLTGAGFGLYAGPELIGGGMITDLVAQSMASASPSQAFTVGFIDDWSRHVSLLRNEDSFDIGFPWYKPDCSAARMLSPQMQTLCSDFQFSRPFAEVPVAFYVRNGDPAGTATSLGALAGKRICRPAGQFTFDLEQAGLASLNVTFERPESALACFAALVRGRVDVVTLAAGDAESEIRLLGIADAIEPVVGLASVQTLHAIVAKANPHATDYLALINRGLENIMRSGKWFETVSSHQGRQIALNG
jgi:polar amino acid transport system substrate-binding protein